MDRLTRLGLPVVHCQRWIQISSPAVGFSIAS